MDLIGRVERLERANRNWRLLAGGMVIAGLVAAAPRPKAPAVIEAREFRAVDERGKTRVLILADEDEASVTLFDAPNSPTRTVGNMRARFSASMEGHASVSFFDRAGNVRHGFGVYDDLTPALLSSDGKVKGYQGAK